MSERPQRIQLRRTKGWQKPPGAVVVSRPSKWGNPWSPKNSTMLTVGGGRITDSRPLTIEECVASYRESIVSGEFGLTVADVVAELRGKDLCCWCPLDKPCHADILLELANKEPTP